MRLCFVTVAVSRDWRFTSYGVIETPSGENHIGVWWWSREELRLVLTIQHTNNTHTVEQQWEFYSALTLIIDIQGRPTVCSLITCSKKALMRTDQRKQAMRSRMWKC